MPKTLLHKVCWYPLPVHTTAKI